MDPTLGRRIDAALLLLSVLVGLVATLLFLSAGWGGVFVGVLVGLLLANAAFSLTDRDDGPIQP